MTPPRIVFMGSPEFALPALRLLAERYPLVGVVTQPDKPAGRGRQLSPPPVKRLAEQLGIAVIQPARLRQPEAMEQLHAWAPDLIVVVAFGQILRPAVLDLPRYGCLNVHASLLPRWRGAAPIQAAILHGDLETGVTIMRLDPGMDTGPTLSQRSLPIAPDDTAATLGEKLAILGANLLLETLPDYLDGSIQPQPQPAGEFPYAHLLKKEDGLLDFTQPAEALARRVRALNPWPGAFTLWDGQPLKIHLAHAVKFGNLDVSGGEAAANIQISINTRLIHRSLPAIAAADGILVLDELQPAGKKPMPGKAFLQGAKNWVG